MSRDAPERAMQAWLERKRQEEAKRKTPPKKPAEIPSDIFGEWVKLVQEKLRDSHR